MTMSVSPATLTERDLYPVHEEDDVPEIPRHERQNTYLRPALRAHLRGSFVTGNVCIYWERGNYAAYVAPDVLVVPHWQPEKDLRVYWLWEDPPVSFVAEVFSASDTSTVRRDKETKYAQHVRAPEYLSYDEERQELKLRRLGPAGYEEVGPLPNGRVRSEQLQLEFGYDEAGFLWIYTLEGEKLPCYEELDEQFEEESERRQEAEARAAEEARRRHEAETRAGAEARQRQEAEARAAELERELSALRARPRTGDD